MTITKKQLDIFGGIGSILCGVVCIWFAMGHNESESIWKVWVGFSALLVLNGIAMFVHAQRDRFKLGTAQPAHSGH